MNIREDHTIREVCHDYGNDPLKMLDIVRTVQERFGAVDVEAEREISTALGVPPSRVRSVVAFYAFFQHEKAAEYVIRLSNDVPDMMAGSAEVAAAFEKELGIKIGEKTPDGKFALEYTPCIGLSDQAPAALINQIPFPSLTPKNATSIVKRLVNGENLEKLIAETGDGNNSHPSVMAAVKNNIRKPGPVIFGEQKNGAGLEKALQLSPDEVIKRVKNSGLRGRGGAGFPTGLKWKFAGEAEASSKYVICNADEGEPGTFKDRVILTEKPELLIEGMAIAAYAIGAAEGIIYLRAEYEYLRQFLDEKIEEARQQGILGENAGGRSDFKFDIEIRTGAGAYICGEESALISSLEGRPGEPSNRPPFPAQKGYLGKPTLVNNVETLCCAARILAEGADWFKSFGTEKSSGTKLLSISGDCKKPGIYELPFGVKIREVLNLCQAKNTNAVQVAGAGGVMLPTSEFDKTISFEEYPTGGSFMVFDDTRDLLNIADSFVEFFIEESCGYCTPCRVGTRLLKSVFDNIRAGRGESADIGYIKELAATIKASSRCGLGQTACNSVLSLLDNFPELFAEKTAESQDGFRRHFNLEETLQAAVEAGQGARVGD